MLLWLYGAVSCCLTVLAFSHLCGRALVFFVIRSCERQVEVPFSMTDFDTSTKYGYINTTTDGLTHDVHACMGNELTNLVFQLLVQVM